MAMSKTAPAGAPATTELTARTLTGPALAERLPAWEEFVLADGRVPLSRHPRWLPALEKGLRHTAYGLEALRDGKVVGYLGLVYVRSLLFGRFLVGLPYLNYGGVVADDDEAAAALIGRAAGLADDLGARYLELRHEWGVEHPALGHRRTDKVHMRLELPKTAGTLWDQLNCKVRNQVRKGQKGGFTAHWGGAELLDEFYTVFNHNMRDLGTPTFGRRLFAAVLDHFPDRSEFCLIRDGNRPVAAALLLHGWGVTEVPSASSLRAYNPACVNMLLYWHLLERAVGRNQEVFDFGRSSEDSPTHRFKKQWGAASCPAEWQYYLRRGCVGEMRPDNPRYQRMIRVWQRLPLAVTRRLGPAIVRGIP
jgi:FemAB-related protein (PEP-CTERM system-associated)